MALLDNLHRADAQHAVGGSDTSTQAVVGHLSFIVDFIEGHGRSTLQTVGSAN